MNMIRRLFPRQRAPEVDLEKAVGEQLLTLPRCSKVVVIISPLYGETQYTCEISVEAEDLLPWAERHAEGVWDSDQDEQAARLALPLWLRGADPNDDKASYIPLTAYEVIRPYVLDFVNEGTAKIYCSHCQSVVTDIEFIKESERQAGGWFWWTDVWKCSQGHQLYYEEQSYISSFGDSFAHWFSVSL